MDGTSRRRGDQQSCRSETSCSTTSKASTADLAWRELKKQDPQKTIDGFWRKFVHKKPGKVFRILPEDLYAKRAAANAPQGLVSAHSTASSFDEAVASCKAKVEKIQRECRLKNQKYTDRHFDIETDLKFGYRECLNGLLTKPYPPGKGPRSVKRVLDIFDDPKFFVDGVSAGDVRQGREGDCWFMAALSSLSNVPELLERICVARDEVVGVYGFVFYRDGEWISTIVDDKLYLTKPDYDESVEERRYWDDRHRLDGEEEYRKAYQTGSGALYFAQCSDHRETWLPLLEKAYAKAHLSYSAIKGGDAGEALEDLTGGVTTEIYTSGILDRDRFWKEELLKVNKGTLFSCFTGIFGGYGERKGIQEMHDYSILKAIEVEGERLLLLRNPWGRVEWTGAWSDGSKEWTPEWMERLQHRFGNDGSFWISYKDLLRKYQCLVRTKVFGPEWSVTQQWTSLQVPWSVDYHDTKFTFVITKPGPVVLVLSQLDDRYFRGLEGQYSYKPFFRLHKEGEDDYIIRSGRTYCLARSVNAEVELEPGHYSVLMKIDATRNTDRPAPEDVVRHIVQERREKLLRVGLSYDLAHAKAHVKETATERKRHRQARANAKRTALRKQKAYDNEQRVKHKRRQAERAERKEAKRAHRRAQAEFEAQKSQQEADGAPKRQPDGAAAGEALTGSPSRDGGQAHGSTANEGSATGRTITGAASTADEDGERDGEGVDEHSQGHGDGDDDDVSSSLYTPSVATSESGESQPHPAALYEDSFAKSPWNAVCVVGLRVYAKDQKVTIEVVRPRETEGEAALDPDDLAADAAKDGRELNEVERDHEQQQQQQQGEEQGEEQGEHGKKDEKDKGTRAVEVPETQTQGTTGQEDEVSVMDLTRHTEEADAQRTQLLPDMNTLKL